MKRQKKTTEWGNHKTLGDELTLESRTGQQILQIKISKMDSAKDTDMRKHSKFNRGTHLNLQ